ncbi:hypothetical protein [Flavobacterium sp.]|uniref:hypothetical protein n=1 Tax=Flavobacterium sp. TaxID=239 RepID=UPI002639ABA9|nr:hypothetical protein [Flavobacterium sp.]
MSFTHKDLCCLAVKWLKRAPSKNGPACQVAFSEAKAGWNGEIPDAIGFRTAAEDEGSVVVEVKVSRPDFLNDRCKAHRINQATGMGLYRYYMAPEGVIDVHELPDKWGLIEVSAKGILSVLAGHVNAKRAAQPSWRHDRAIEREWLLLAAMLSRLGDVEALHNELKRLRNELARTARQSDINAEQARLSNLRQAITLGDQPVVLRKRS